MTDSLHRRRKRKNNINVVNTVASEQLKYDMDRAIGDMVVKKLEG